MLFKKKIAAIAILLFIILLLAASAFPAFLPAFAAEEGTDTGYARVVQEDVYLYAAPQSDSGLFILPRTYFVRLTGQAGGYYSVEYLSGTNAVQGYCRTEDLEPVDYIPETPFLEYETEVTFTAGSGDLPDGFITEYSVPASFYGTFYYGSSVYYYVSIGGETGYVPASACPPLNYPENTEHTQTEIPDSPEQPSGNTNVVNIVLICALSVAALGAVYFLFRPARGSEPRSVPFDDYEQLD